MTALRTPPMSIEAEQGVLGALMIDNDAMSRIDVALEPEHFYRDSHRIIYRTIRRMLAEGRPADVLTVFEDLQRNREDGQCDGLSYLGELHSSTFSAANVRRYAQIVVERAMLRALLSAADEISAKVSEPGEVKEKLDFAQGRIMALSDNSSLGGREPRSVAALMDDCLDDLERRWRGAGENIRTGFPDLDSRISGGMEQGQLIIIAGRPGMGKTTLAMQIAEYCAANGTPALVCSQEMPSVQLVHRSVASNSRVPLDAILTNNMDDAQYGRVCDSMKELKALSLYIDEQGALRLEDVRRKARRVAQKHGLGLLVIDYLQLMVGEESETRNMEITRISGGLKALAKELRIPVIALSQLSRKCEERPNKKPVMSDLRESGSLEQDADLILATYRDEVYNPSSKYQGLAELLVLKNRQGKSGGFIPLVFHGGTFRFESMYGDWPSEEVASPSPSRKKFAD